MDVNIIFSKMEDYLESDFSVYVISGVHKEKFKKSLEMMWHHIDILENNGVIEDFDPLNTPRVIEECINHLMYVSLESKMTNMLAEFVNNYIFVVFNWNTNVWKNNNFNNKIQYLQRFVDGRLNLDEAVDVLNKLSLKLGRYKEWLPPAFELSRHYYNLLKED